MPKPGQQDQAHRPTGDGRPGSGISSAHQSGGGSIASAATSARRQRRPAGRSTSVIPPTSTVGSTPREPDATPPVPLSTTVPAGDAAILKWMLRTSALGPDSRSRAASHKDQAPLRASADRAARDSQCTAERTGLQDPAGKRSVSQPVAPSRAVAHGHEPVGPRAHAGTNSRTAWRSVPRVFLKSSSTAWWVTASDLAFDADVVVGHHRDVDVTDLQSPVASRASGIWVMLITLKPDWA